MFSKREARLKSQVKANKFLMSNFPMDVMVPPLFFKKNKKPLKPSSLQ